MALSEAQVADFWRDGYLLVPGLLSVAEVDLLAAEIRSLEDRHHAQPPPGLVFSTVRPRELVMADGDYNIAVVGGPLSRLLRYRPLLEHAQQLIGSPIKLTGAGYLDGGRPTGGHYWHQDTGIVCDPFFGQGDAEHLPTVSTTGLELSRNVSVRIALDPADTAEVGALRLLPTSHLENTLAHGVNHRPPRAREVVQQLEPVAVMPPHRPGGALFYNPLTFHSSSRAADADNTDTGRRRRIVTAFYGPADLRMPVYLGDGLPADGRLKTSAPATLMGQGRAVSWLETFVFPGYTTPLRPLDSLLPLSAAAAAAGPTEPTGGGGDGGDGDHDDGDHDDDDDDDDDDDYYDYYDYWAHHAQRALLGRSDLG